MKTRSDKKELLDLGPGHYSKEEYEDCLTKLALINKILGMRRESLKLINQIRPKTILDVGCGGGEFLWQVAKSYPTIDCLGIDISEEAINYAQKYACENLLFSKQLELENADLIFATLVCHHMPDVELVDFLADAYQHANMAVVIHDLQRSHLSKFLYSFLAPLLFQNRLITHDGLISIERSFRRKDWKRLLHLANIDNIDISWRFPFRWEVILWKR